MPSLSLFESSKLHTLFSFNELLDETPLQHTYSSTHRTSKVVVIRLHHAFWLRTSEVLILPKSRERSPHHCLMVVFLFSFLVVLYINIHVEEVKEAEAFVATHLSKER
jgi:hypothetical protein